MSRRTRRANNFTRERQLEILGRLDKTRNYLCRLHADVKPFGADYRALSKVKDAIDDLAETWTGDRTHLHLKPAPAGGWSSKSEANGKA